MGSAMMCGRCIVGAAILAASTLTGCAAAAIDGTNFKEKVADSNKVWMLEFYSDMCGSCQEFAPTWSEVDKLAQGKVETGKVKVDDSAGAELAEKLGVFEEGIPNV